MPWFNSVNKKNGIVMNDEFGKLEEDSCGIFQDTTLEKLKKKVIGEPWFPELTLKTVLNYDFYWNKCNLYIKIETLLKHYYMYSTLFTEITQSI
jgi:hypothetical protein